MKYLMIPVILLIGYSIAKSQNQRPYRVLATQKVHQRLLRENPGLSEEMLKIERKISRNHNIENHLKDGYIPLYFHIVYGNEQERVSIEQILGQIEVLNNDFALSTQPDELDIQPAYAADQNGNTQKYKIELMKSSKDLLNIKFCLAKPTGNSPSISYIVSPVETWGLDDAIKFKKEGGADAVQPQKKLNVWIANLGGQVSGYAQLPGGPDQTDGIVIDYRFFGVGGTAQVPYDLGKTMTHLVGNYLGLNDLWNENTPCADDQVEDTPVHGSPNAGCPQYLHLSSCIEGEAEMTMNFMDNTDDICQSLFTVGQMKRMYSMLIPGGPRNTLLSGASKCDFPEEAAFLPEVPTPSKLPQVLLSPNPAQGSTTLEIRSETASREGVVHIYSSLGKLLFSAELEVQIGSNELKIPTDRWSSGIYLLHLQIDEVKVVRSLSVVRN